MRLILVRHCQSEGPAPDATLTPQGVLDSWTLVGRLEALGVDAVYSSPYARAAATVMPFVVAAEADIRFDARLRERAVRHIDGFEAWLEHMRRGFADPRYRLDGEECFADAAARGCAALAEIAGAGHRLPAIASHGQLISAILHTADPGFGFDQWRALAMPHLIEAEHDGERLVSFRSLSGNP